LVETETYKANGYVWLPRLLPVEVVHALYRRLQEDLEASANPLGAFVSRGAVLRREALEVYAYQYPPLLGFLWGLTPRIAEAAGADLLPTYAYFRLYQHDDVCRIHSDRLACEHSLSLTVAYANDLPWEFSVATQKNEALDPSIKEDFDESPFGSVAMQPGDGVLYQGTHHRHGRLRPNPNAWSAHLFLHWVDRNGPYKEQAFDRPTMERNSRDSAAWLLRV